MDGDATSETRNILRRTVRQIADAHLAPKAAHWDRTQEPPLENLDVLREHGLLGVGVPEALGGQGGGLLDFVIVAEEIARGCANTAILATFSCGGTLRALDALGSEALKGKYVADIAQGRKIAAWSMTEPDTGSDVGSIRTHAVRDGDDYVINGTKTYCTYGAFADIYLVLMRLDGIEGTRGIGAVLIERDTPGFTVGRKIDCMGLRATGMSEIVFQDCRVPAANVVVPAGGLRDLLGLMDADRIIANPPICLGVAQGAFEEAVEFLRNRVAFGRPLADFQGLQWMLADMAMDLEAARALLYRAAARFDAGEHSIIDASIAKTYTNEMAIRVTEKAIQLQGTAGFTRELPAERHYRDVRGLAIGYGTTQIQRNAIAREILQGRYQI